MSKKNFNEVLKAREAAEAARDKHDDGTVHLDDTSRVKVLSPGQLVWKRFLRNKLAIVGSVILIFMFLFSFAGPLFYAYDQTDIFYKYDYLTVNYASATQRTDYTNYTYDSSLPVHKSITNKITSIVSTMEAAGQTSRFETDSEGSGYLIEKQGDYVYTTSAADYQLVASKGVSVDIGTYNKMLGEMTWTDQKLGDEFLSALEMAVLGKKDSFTFEGAEYSVAAGSVKNTYKVTRGGDDLSYTAGMPAAGFDKAFESRESETFTCGGKNFIAVESGAGVMVYQLKSVKPAMISSTFVFDMYDTSVKLTDTEKAEILMNLYGSGETSIEGKEYFTRMEEDTFYLYEGTETEPTALLSDFAVRRYSGEDTLPVEFKAAAQTAIEEMQDGNLDKVTFTYALPELDETGNEMKDENGQTVTVDTEITITQKVGQFVLTCDQLTYLIDIYASPSSEHVFGTDADGMDVLSRMMYGGRISLMVGFVVVILECILGVIMGGIAGYFGGWVDTLIMRLVDVFYCIPSMPILIIMGAFFDDLRMGSYMRLVWMMAVLGILGWAGVARLVRGQILSLREQEFMTAAEATGLSTSRRIFRHLIPNVMPQLIVNATMGLGSVIITESTLSFLGLGVKHPLATWGSMINSITSSSENLVRYAYIWIPVGCLICLTVIAFNFVGDGLRDAFDPKMKQ